MSSRTFYSAIGAIVALGGAVGYLGAAKPIGGDIKDQKDALRTQWARAEAVRSGMDPGEAQRTIGKIETRGGDSGLRYTGKGKGEGGRGIAGE